MKRALSVALCCVLAACGGGGGGGSPTPPTVKQPSSKATVQVKILVPAISQTASAALRRAMSAAASTSGAIFTVYAHGGSSSSPILQTAVDLTAGGGNCTPSGTGRSCTVSFEAPTGTANDLLVQTLDAAPVNGVISGGHVLSAGTLANINVVAGQSNTFSLTLNPVVNAVSISTTPRFLHTFYPSPTHPAFTVNLNALDADGNIIVAGSYVDLTGNPVTIPLSIANNPNNSLALSTSSVTGSGTVITGTYNGGADTAANSTTSVTIQTTGAFAATSTLKMIAPTVTTHALAHAMIPSTSGYNGAAYLQTASGNQVWLVDTDSSLTTGGIEAYDVASATSSPEPGPAGNVIQGGIVGAATTSGMGAYTGGTTMAALKPYSPSVSSLGAASCTGSCSNIASALSYNSSALKVAWISGTTLAAYDVTTQTTSSLATVSSSNVTGLSYDGAGNIWYCDPSTSSMYEWSGSTPLSYSVNSCFDVTFDGTSIWFTDPSNQGVGSMMDPISSGVGIEWFTTGQTPRYIASDPSQNDPGVYASYNSASGIGIARYDSTTQYVAMTSLSTSGGQAGPVVVSNTGDRVYVVHYTTGGGELMEIIP